MRNGVSKKLRKYWVQYRNLFLIEGILYRKHQTQPNFETVYQMLVRWRRVSNVLELLHYSPSAGHFGIEKTCKRACERFYWSCMRRDVRNWIESCDVCLKRKSTKQKHWHSITKWKPSHPFWFGNYLLISWVHFPCLRETSTNCLSVINSVSGTKP